MPATFSFSFGDFAPPSPRTWAGKKLKTAVVAVAAPRNLRREIRCMRVWTAAKVMLFALRFMAERMIHQHQRRHRFHHRHGARQYARIVTATTFQGRVLKFDIHGVLFVHDRGDGLESDAEVNGLAIGDTALDAAGTVAGRADFSFDH